MEDRITVNMGAANLVVEPHFDPGARRKGLYAVFILRPCGKRISPYVCPMNLPDALNAVEAAKGEVFPDAFAANAWLDKAWEVEAFRAPKAA